MADYSAGTLLLSLAMCVLYMCPAYSAPPCAWSFAMLDPEPQTYCDDMLRLEVVVRLTTGTRYRPGSLCSA